MAASAAGAPAQAQSNLDAGKTPAQIFSDTCAACHRSARELRPTNAGFLREHYSTGGREAAAMAGYLAAVGSDPRAVQQRRPPGQGAPAEAAARPTQTTPGVDPARPAETRTALPTATPGRNGPSSAEPAKPQTAKPRRPSDSIEVGKLPVPLQAGEVGADPSQAVATPGLRPPAESFEE
jgi:hypothetical protein